jgi:hypothetical protein
MKHPKLLPNSLWYVVAMGVWQRQGQRTRTLEPALNTNIQDAEDGLCNVVDAQIILEEAFCYVLIIYVPCQTVCIVNSVNCPRGQGYVLSLLEAPAPRYSIQHHTTQGQDAPVRFR